MKTFLIKKLLVPTVHAFAAATILLALGACAGVDSRPKTAALPIETIHGNTGQITSARAYEASGRLYVAGASRAASRGAHVDIQLIGRQGEVIARQSGTAGTGSAHPRTARARHGHGEYVASFPLSEAQQASRIVVTYHYGSHAS